MARAGFYKSDLHGKVARFEKGGWYSFSPMGRVNPAYARHQSFDSFSTFRVDLDLRPMAAAIGEIPDLTLHGPMLQTAMRRTLVHLKEAYQHRLVVWTGINVGARGRLNKGVRLRTSYHGGLGIEGRYTITDRYLSITPEYFNAIYSKRPGQPGGLARWGKPTIWKGVRHTAWGRQQVTPRSFMIPGLKPAWLRYPGAQRKPIVRVWGPNPAKELGVHHAEEARLILRQTALTYFNVEVGRAYQDAVATVKARHGL